MCNLVICCLRGWGISITIIDHCSGRHERVLFIQRTLQESPVNTESKMPLLYNVPLLLSRRTLLILLQIKSSRYQAPLSLKVPPPRQLLQEVHNKWRQTQEAGRAVMLRSYFSYPLLPSQDQAPSTSPPEHQLLNATRKKPALHSPPSSLRKQPVQCFS